MIHSKRMLVQYSNVSSIFIGLTLLARNSREELDPILVRASEYLDTGVELQLKCFASAFLAERAIKAGEYQEALLLADRSWRLAEALNFERDYIRALNRQGHALLGLYRLGEAEPILHQSLLRSRAVNFGEEELVSLLGLSELRRQQKDWIATEELLSGVFQRAIELCQHRGSDAVAANPLGVILP